MTDVRDPASQNRAPSVYDELHQRILQERRLRDEPPPADFKPVFLWSDTGRAA